MKRNWLLTGLAALTVGALSACSDSEEIINNDDPAQPDTEEVTEKTVALWVDYSSNADKFLTKQGIDNIISKAHDAGFNTLVVDVRPTSGESPIPSKYMPRINHWDTPGLPAGNDIDTSWDYLQYFIDKAHALDMKVFADIQTFTGGRNVAPKRGIVYQDASLLALTSKGITVNNELQPSENDSRGVVFLNPCLTQVQTLISNIAKEIVTNYDIDGFCFDRGRYDTVDADFSAESEAQFKAYMKQNYGRDIANFPACVMSVDKNGTKTKGVYINQWYEWRASVIKGFYSKLCPELKAIRPNVKLSVYTSAVYQDLYQEGINPASESYDPFKVTAYSSWSTSLYKNTGYAELFDVYFPGCYARPTNISGTSQWSIEGGLNNALAITNGANQVVCTLACEYFITETEQQAFTTAVQLAMSKCAGVAFFDLYHIERYNQWAAIKTAISSTK